MAVVAPSGDGYYVAVISPESVRTPKWAYLAPLGAGVFFSFLALIWMPWEIVHPDDPSLRQAVGYAPYWSHRFAGITGAQVDWGALGVNLAVIWVICFAGAIMLGMSTRRD